MWFHNVGVFWTINAIFIFSNRSPESINKIKFLHHWFLWHLSPKKKMFQRPWKDSSVVFWAKRIRFSKHFWILFWTVNLPKGFGVEAQQGLNRARPVLSCRRSRICEKIDTLVVVDALVAANIYGKIICCVGYTRGNFKRPRLHSIIENG